MSTSSKITSTTLPSLLAKRCFSTICVPNWPLKLFQLPGQSPANCGSPFLPFSRTTFSSYPCTNRHDELYALRRFLKRVRTIS